MTRTERAALYELRAKHLTRLLATLPASERVEFEKHFAAGLEEVGVAVGILRDPHATVGETDLYLGPVEQRYLLLYWTTFNGDLDEINPDDWETTTDSLAQVRELVEQHVCRNEPADYGYRCRAFDLSAGTDLQWYEVHEIRWGVRPTGEPDEAPKGGHAIYDEDEDVEPAADPAGPVVTMFWGRTNVGSLKTWHAFTAKPEGLPREKSTIGKHFKMREYVGTAVCGAAGVRVVGVTDIPLDDKPYVTDGRSIVCEACEVYRRSAGGKT